MQDYEALVTSWNGETGSIAERLAALNEAGWPQEHGWNGPINQNDLVPAGIITDEQRIDWEVAKNLISAAKGDELKEMANGNN